MKKFKAGDVVFIRKGYASYPQWGISGDVGIVECQFGDSVFVRFDDYGRTWAHFEDDVFIYNKRTWCREFLKMMDAHNEN
jgi:hypothetical protein